MRDQPVGLGQKRIERRIGDAERVLLGLRQAPPLEIEHAHPEGDGAGRDLAADLAKPDQAKRRAVEQADAGNAAPVRIGRVPPVERLVGMACFRELADGDAADKAVKLARLRQHQRERVLGAGDVGAAADGEHGHAAFGAGGGVDGA